MFRSLFLTCLVFSICVPSLSAFAQTPSGEEVLFEDRFEGTLMPGWEWLRGNAPCRRIVNNSLEILTEPFASGEARNALVRPLNFFLWKNGATVGSYRIETECYFLGDHVAPGQQCGIYWIHNDNKKVVFKLVFAKGDDDQMYVYPGKVPVKTAGGRLRLTVAGRNVIAEFCELDDTTFRRVYEGRINCCPNDSISLQCRGGQKDGVNGAQEQGQWARFQYFRVEKFDD